MKVEIIVVGAISGPTAMAMAGIAASPGRG
jgi:hypothetical protein